MGRDARRSPRSRHAAGWRRCPAPRLEQPVARTGRVPLRQTCCCPQLRQKLRSVRGVDDGDAVHGAASGTSPGSRPRRGSGASPPQPPGPVPGRRPRRRRRDRVHHRHRPAPTARRGVPEQPFERGALVADRPQLSRQAQRPGCGQQSARRQAVVPEQPLDVPGKAAGQRGQVTDGRVTTVATSSRTRGGIPNTERRSRVERSSRPRNRRHCRPGVPIRRMPSTSMITPSGATVTTRPAPAAAVRQTDPDDAGGPAERDV